jgi:hypothetical protein
MSKFVVSATWDDVPHLSEEVKRELLAGIPPYQRDARTKGVPQLGSGAIYPVPETDIIVDDFEIPLYWPRSYAMDVGWNKTANIWGARNNQTGQIFLYSEHYRGKEEPVIHAEAIKARGAWIPGAIDPAAMGSSQRDGKQLMSEYRKLGLNLTPAQNAVEAGIYKTWQMLSSGQLKVFRSCRAWLNEFRTYQRDKDGKIIDDHKYHLMAATRYFALTGIEIMKIKPFPQTEEQRYVVPSGIDGGWMG